MYYHQRTFLVYFEGQKGIFSINATTISKVTMPYYARIKSDKIQQIQVFSDNVIVMSAQRFEIYDYVLKQSETFEYKGDRKVYLHSFDIHEVNTMAKYILMLILFQFFAFIVPNEKEITDIFFLKSINLIFIIKLRKQIKLLLLMMIITQLVILFSLNINQQQLQIIIEYKPKTRLVQCSWNCQDCKEEEPDKCLSCYDQMVLDPIKNTCNCGIGYYLDNYYCQKCSSSCETCSSYSQCITCKQDTNRVLGSNQVCICKDSFYEYDQQCLECPKKCQTCSYDSQKGVICLTCQSDPTRKNSEYCECINGFYDDGQSIQCQKCPQNCLQCQKNGVVISCVQCDIQNTYRLNNQICSCQNGYYDVNMRECVKCKNDCQICDQNGICSIECKIDNCISCEKNLCIKCKPMYFLINNKCEDKCFSNQFSDFNNGICIDCPQKCMKCSQDPKKCEQCDNETYLYNNKCDNSCPVRYYENKDQRKCVNCPLYCKSCNKDKCEKCDDGKNLFGELCVDYCPDQFYSKDNVCLKCSTNCLKCNESKCNQCLTGKYLKEEKCEDSCLDRFYTKNGICKSCDKDCLNCDEFKCNQCMTGKYLNNGQCLDSCLEGYVEISGVCQQCKQNSNCKHCDSKFECTECNQDYFLFSDQCTQGCPQGYYKDMNDKKCKECTQVKECEECDLLNPKICKYCASNYFNQQGVCLKKCLQGFHHSVKERSCQECKVQNCKECVQQIDQCSLCMDNFEKIGDKCEEICKQNQKRNQKGQCKDIMKNSFYLKSENKNNLTINFQNKILNEQEIKSNLIVSIPQMQSNYTYEIKIIDQQNIQVQIQTEAKINDMYLINVYIKNQEFYEYENNEQNVQVQIANEEKINAKEQAAATTLAAATQAVSTATVAALFPLALSGNFWMISSILDISQIIYMTSFIDFENTYIMRTFLSSQKNFQIPFPNYFKFINHYDEINYKTASKIEQNDIQGFFLSNLGDTLSLIVTILLIKALLKGLFKISNKYQKTKKIIGFILEKFFPVNLYIDLLWSVYQDICFSVIVQLISLNSPLYTIETINYFLFAFCSIGIASPLYLIYLIKSRLNKKIYDYLTNDLHFKYFVVILYFRKFFYSIVAGFIQTSPNMQLTLIIVFNIMYLIAILLLKPYNQKFNNIKEIFQSTLFALSHMIILGMKNQDKNTSQKQNNDKSWAVLALFTTAIFFEVIICLKEVYLSLKELYLKYKEKKRIQKVNPIQEKESGIEFVKDQTHSQNIVESVSPILNPKSKLQSNQNSFLEEFPTKIESRLQISNIDQRDISSQLTTQRSPIRKQLKNKVTYGSAFSIMVHEEISSNNAISLNQILSNNNIEETPSASQRIPRRYQSIKLLSKQQSQVSILNQEGLSEQVSPEKFLKHNSFINVKIDEENNFTLQNNSEKE